MPEQSPEYQQMLATSLHYFVLLVGLCVGSFLNVAIARVPEGLSIVRPRSRCPKCEKQIEWYDNIPLVSWLALGGRCRNCKTTISPRYPIVELLTGLLAFALARRFGITPLSLGLFVFVCLLIVVSYIDLDHWLIPVDIVLVGTGIGVLSALVNPDLRWWEAALGAGGGFGLFALIAVIGTYVFKKPALGKGDWYLLAMIGAFLGWKALLPVILVASLLGSIVGVALLVLGRGEPGLESIPQSVADATEGQRTNAGPSVTPLSAEVADKPATADVVHPDEDDENWVPPKNAVPFGPFLALGAMMQLFMGDWLRDTYFRLIMSMGG